MCVGVSGHCPHAHVSPSLYLHLFCCSLLQVYHVLSLYSHCHVVLWFSYPFVRVSVRFVCVMSVSKFFLPFVASYDFENE